LTCFAHIDALNARMGMRATQNLSPEQPRQVQVRCIKCPSANLIATFFSRDGFPDYLEVRHVKTYVVILLSQSKIL
jgi:hypothetical protein